MEEKRSLSLIKKLDQKLKKTGFDEKFLGSLSFHSKQVFCHDETKVTSREDICNFVMSAFFLKKIDMYPEKKFISKVQENSDWPIPILPLEFFSNLPDEFKIKCFYQFLQNGHILDCRVASVLPSEYLLRVIHKPESSQILDDLNIMVKLPRMELPEENELLLCELVRVAVKKISRRDDTVTITVTLNKNGEKLGRIPEENLPSYVLDPPDIEKYVSYSNYLLNMPQFNNVTLLNEFFDGFGLDPKRIYSFKSDYDRLKCLHENTGKELLRQSRIADAKKFAQDALKQSEIKQFSAALNFINTALKLCPKDEPVKASLYQIRGDIYKEMKQLKNCVWDYMIAYYLSSKSPDKSYDAVKKQLSKFFFKAANKYYHIKEYRTAVDYAEISLDIDAQNSESATLLDHLKKKHSDDALVNLEAESLSELHKKKKKLQSKLKKYEPKTE